MEILANILITFLSVIVGIPLTFVLVFLLAIPLGLVFFPSHWIFSEEHTRQYGRVYGIKNKLIHHYLDYSYPNKRKYYWWGSKMYGDEKEIVEARTKFEKEYGELLK